MRKIFFLLVVVVISINAKPQLTGEQVSIKKTFFDFLAFYQKNEEKFYSFKLYKGVGENNDPPYHIQWKEVEKYFSWLRSNVPYVGEEYIKNEKKDFQFYDSCFKAEPDEEIPFGFDYDRWAGGQESIEYMIVWYTSPKNKYVVNINGDKAELKIGSELWQGAEEKDRAWSVVPFVREKGVWKMAANVYPSDNE